MRAILQRLRRDDLLRHGSLLSAATILGTVILFVFNVYMARTLGPNDFGSLGALLAIFAISSQIGNAVQLTVAKKISELSASGNLNQMGGLLLSSSRFLFLVSLALFAGFLAAAPLISDFLRLSSPVPVMLVGASIVFYLVLPTFRGALQGLQSFKWLTINRVGERVVLLVAGSILVSLGFGIEGVMVALGVAGVAMLALAFVPLRAIIRNSVSSTDWKELVLKGAPVLVTVLGIALLANLDLVIAKHFLSSEDAGLYSAIARTGRIVFFISVAFSRALFPKASKAQALGRSPTSLIVRSLGYIGAFCVVAIIAAAVIGRPLIGIVYGSEYKEIAFLLPWYIGAVSLLSVTTVMMYYNLSLSVNRHVIPLIAAVVLQVVLLNFFHDSPLQIVIILILSITPLFLVNVILQFSWTPSAKQLPINAVEGDD